MDLKIPFFFVSAAILLAGSLAFGAAAAAPTTQSTPERVQNAAIEVRAQEAFNAGDYPTALVLLKKVAELRKGDADRSGVIEEQMRVCERVIAARGGAPTSQPSVVAQTPAQGESRKPHVRPAGDALYDVDIKALGNFEYDPVKGGGIPKDVTDLSGVHLRTRGFMVPLDQADNISEFALVPSLFACCFGQPPQLQHTIIVHCPAGKGVPYFPDEIQVTGMLTVDEKREDGFIVSVFEIAATSVAPAPK